MLAVAVRGCMRTAKIGPDLWLEEIRTPLKSPAWEPADNSNLQGKSKKGSSSYRKFEENSPE